MSRDQSLIFILIIGLVSSCAGPMNPFGALGFKLTQEERSLQFGDSLMRRLPASRLKMNEKAKIRFFPERQNFHDASQFKVIIEDPKGLSQASHITILLNNKDITSQVLALADIKILDEGRELEIGLSHIRFRAEDENQIIVMYSNHIADGTIFKNYEMPHCQLEGFEPIQSFSKFKHKKEIFSLVELLSYDKELNPNFISGLIAQESSFNPRAVSRAKAIGLTQITRLAEKQILNSSDEWPRNNKISKYSVPFIKALIYRGQINEKNEWRLDQEKSILGSIRYLNFIKEYWAHPDRLKDLREYFPPEDEKIILPDIILASYNSGPYRVRSSLQKRGYHWLDSPNLKEAKKYVRRVKSYCHTFANNNEARDEDQTFHF